MLQTIIALKFTMGVSLSSFKISSHLICNSWQQHMKRVTSCNYLGNDVLVTLMDVELQYAFNCTLPIVGDIASLCKGNNMISSAIWW